MADDTKKGKPGRDAIPADERELDNDQDVDVLFRGQMAVTNFLLGYWKHLLLVLAVLLAGVYAYASWKDGSRDHQRELQASLAQIDRDLPEPDQLYAMGLGPMDDPADEARITELKASASRYEDVAREGAGAAKVMAWIKAAETWTRAQDAEKSLAAWQAAYDSKSKGALKWAATTGLATAMLDAGDVDGAAALYKTYAAEGKGYTAERALFELGKLYEGAGRTAESKQVYEEFAARFPDSPLTPRVAEASRRVRDAG